MRPKLLHFLQDFQAASIAERKVEHRDIPILLEHKLAGLGRRARFTENCFGQHRIEDSLDAFANDFVIVDQQYSLRTSWIEFQFQAPAAIGTCSVIVVPSPSALSMLISAPTRYARSR